MITLNSLFKVDVIGHLNKPNTLEKKIFKSRTRITYFLIDDL